jgi:hypothetical protein
LEDAAAQFLRGGSNPVDGRDDSVHQLVHVERTAVGEFSFGERPNAFIGIELWSVSRKVLDVKTRVSPQKVVERCPVVGGGVVQQHDDRTPEVAQQLAEKQAHLFLPDVVEVKQIVEAQVLSSRTAGDSGDDGDFVPASLAMALKRGAALGCPSLGHQGSQ